ncbi:MAG: hypothetical protein C0421_01530 [Hyphomonas sp.]|uniref:hypothetical protein n=1 Tax=Hyphomonas sp. TaxID=87 RepID=UPI0025C5B84F|nr:hypothetical protein [Hyphomonas sp.]MBA4337509.1 hypothetical protein [Hyphomonas sp.]
MTEDATPLGAKAGWHIWPVGILAAVWNGYGCFDFMMKTTRNPAYTAQFAQDIQTYWYSMPWWMFGLWSVGVFGALIASLALLMRSKTAVTLFAAAFIASAASFYVRWQEIVAPPVKGMEFMPFVILVIGFALTAYAYWQSTRGVLR